MDNLFNIKPINFNAAATAALPETPYKQGDSRGSDIPPVTNTAQSNKTEPYKEEKGGNQAQNQFDRNDCQTCSERKYVDGSNDPGVSFKTPTKVSPGNAASAVMSHEQQHVSRNRAKAQRTGSEIVSQSVTIHTGICSECGRGYVSGGTTRTVSRKVSNDTTEVMQNLGITNANGTENK